MLGYRPAHPPQPKQAPMAHRFLLVDVFSDRPFGGNQLAVFPDARSLDESLLQPIARELCLTETVFVYPSTHRDCAARIRIFTPDAEVPFAGHPVVGTAFVLDREGMLPQGCDELCLQLEGGKVPVLLQRGERGNVRQATMVQQRPVFLGEFARPDAVAAALGLHPDDLAITGLPCEVVSTGLPFHIVPVGTLEAMGRISLQPDKLAVIEKLLGFRDLFVFSFETVDESAHVHCRMFAPGFGIPEDPATGSASGALGAYLVKNRVLPAREEHRITSEQGLEMGRPSRLEIEVDVAGGKITDVRVGGAAVIIGEGRLEL